MKRFVFFLLSLLLSSQISYGADSLQVYTIDDLAPFDFRDEYGKVIGFDVDLIQAVSQDQGLNVKIEAAPFQTIFQNVTEGNGDMIILPLGATAERKKILNLSDSYVIAPNAIAFADKNLRINKLSDLEGKKVAVIEDSPYISLINAQNPASIIELKTNFLVYSAIWTGKAEVAYSDEKFLLYMLKTRPNHPFQVITTEPEEGDTDDAYWAITKKKPELLKIINKGLSDIRKNGEYNKIYQKWFGNGA